MIAVSDASSVQVLDHRPVGRLRGTLILVHGMAGSADSAYMRRTANVALVAGWRVLRMNLRNCGGTEALASTFYNAGQSDDVGCVLRWLDSVAGSRPYVTAGFSLGGNVVLRHAAVPGDSPSPDAVVAVNPPVDLDRCATAIEAPPNRAYQWHYVRRLRNQLKQIALHRPLPVPLRSRREIGSVRRFDALYTAPDAGFPSAEAYYSHASADPVLSRLERPGAILSARNDPFVPWEMFEGRPWEGRLQVTLASSGGHCGFWQAGKPRFWAADWILDRAEGLVRRRA